MTGRSRVRSARILGGTATVGLIAAATAVFVTAGAGHAATVSKNLNFTCPFPIVGDKTVAVQIDATLPDTGTVGSPIKTTNFSTSATVDANTASALTVVGATSVSGSADAGVTVTTGTDVQNVDIPGLTIPSTPVPPSGQTLTVVASGAVPDVNPTVAGTAVIAVGNFNTTLTPVDATGAPTGLGTFTLACTLDAGQDATLASIPIAPAVAPTTTTTAPPTTTTAPPTTTTTKAPPTTTTTAPPTTTTTTAPPTTISITFNASGTTHVKQLNADIPLGPGTLATAVNLTTGTFTGDLTLPEASASFKLFGLLPATAKVQFTPVGQTTGTLQGSTVTSDTKVTIRLVDIRVLGVPLLAKNAKCQTMTPADLALSSTSFSPLTGGTVSGTYTIPQFSGCGLVNPIVNLTVPGAGNTASLTLTPKAA
jgi:hypothetical protein